MATPGFVPTVPVGDGNNVTSPNPQYKYDFVINNWTDDEFKFLCQTMNSVAKKCVVSSEIGEENGTPHLQCYVSLKKKMRIVNLRELQGLHRASFRKVRNEAALIDYCNHTGIYADKQGEVLFTIGMPRPIKIISVLRPWQAKIEAIYNGEPDDRKIYWFWEPIGNVGKSAFVKYMIIKHKALFCDGGKKSDLINLVFNNDMDICKCVIWDLPRGTKGNISYATLECVKNGMVCNTKYETGVKCFNPPHIFVFANFPPDDPEQLSPDRWVITELN